MGYTLCVAVFSVLLLYFSMAPKNYESLKYFSKVSQMSDAAFYTDVYAVRFYSVSKAQDLWDDPFLPPRNGVDFIYRMKR